MTELPTASGTDFVGFRIEEVLGRGGMGVVYRAYDLRLRRIVAFKVIAPELALEEHFRERFSRESELAMSLEHPNVVPIYDAGDVDGRLYLAMRLVVGTDLRKLLHTERALEPARALAICNQVAGALDAAHAKGLVHRDVKPSNVLLDENEHVYLADFGLTRRLGEQGTLVTDSRSVGTPAYLAPEQVEGRPVDGRADVYALSCMLFECLTGAPPYARASPLEVAWAHLEEEPPRASRQQPDLPATIDGVISRALAKEPEHRYVSCGALTAAAESALGLRRSMPFRRRRAALLAAAFVIAMLAAAGAIAAVLATDGHGKVAVPLFAGANTLARIDPTTNRVSAVIDVGRSPAASAVGGQSAWVYNRDDWTISEIDARTNRVLKTTPVPGLPAGCCANFTGPVLAADASGAWFISGDLHGNGLLTRLLAGRRGQRGYRLELTPTGVAVGEGAVWVVGRGARDYQVLRIDPDTGLATARTRFSATTPIDSIAVGFGYVWVVGSADAILYRIDPRTARRAGNVEVGNPPAARPQLQSYGGDLVNVPNTTRSGSIVTVSPSSLAASDTGCSCQPDWGENGSAFGSDWYDDWPTGSVYRQWAPNGPTRRIAVVANLPVGRGPCLTSMAIGAGSFWVTVAPSVSYTCSR
jgi:serine/threonine-protein kinase